MRETEYEKWCNQNIELEEAWDELEKYCQMSLKQKEVINQQKEIIRDRQKQIEKLEDILKRIQAFHGCHKIYTKDIANGYLYELDITEIDERLTKYLEE